MNASTLSAPATATLSARETLDKVTVALRQVQASAKFCFRGRFLYFFRRSKVETLTVTRKGNGDLCVRLPDFGCGTRLLTASPCSGLVASRVVPDGSIAFDDGYDGIGHKRSILQTPAQVTAAFMDIIVDAEGYSAGK